MASSSSSSSVITGIKKTLINIPGDQAEVEDAALKKAQEINESYKGSSYGFAKAICTLVCESHLIQWQVRVLEICPYTSKRTQKWPSPSSSSAPSSSRSSTPSSSKIITPTEQTQFSRLSSAIQAVIQFIEEQKPYLDQQKKVESKLRRLLIYLMQTDTWPCKQSIEAVSKVFSDYLGCLRSKQLSTGNQEAFNKFVSQLSERLRDQSIDLEGISTKIVTKSQRASPAGLNLFNRLQKLIATGTERILSSKKHTHADVVHFSKVFAFHAYVYKPHIDSDQARLELKHRMDRLVELLVAYDHLQNASTLCEWMFELVEQIRSHFAEEQNLGTALTPLVWTLETLVHNRSFIEYMQPLGRHDKRIIDRLPSLFLQEKVWKAVAVFIVSLGDRNLFNEVLKRRINPDTHLFNLSQAQLESIFFNLNQMLKHFSDKREYREIYLLFLDRLARSDKLHLLQPYVRHQDHIQDVFRNLEALDFQFMDAMPLESFFGNATYRAVNEKMIPPGMNVKQTLVRLFTRYSSNPVEQESGFLRALSRVLDDFSNGFELLCEEVLSKFGELAAPGIIEEGGQRRLISVERWLSTSVKNGYRAIKGYILMCLPLKWEIERFDGSTNPLGCLCLHEEKLHLIRYDSQHRQPVLQDFFIPESSSERPSSALVTACMDEIKELLHAQLQIQQNRNAVAYLTEAYMSFHNHERIQQEMERLLKSIFKKLQGRSVGSFADRMHILADFLHVMSPFFKKLECLIEKRLFTEGRLKRNIASNLVTQAQQVGRVEVGETLRNLTEAPEVIMGLEVVKELSQLLSFLCVNDVEEILEPCPLDGLKDITPQLEHVICRKVDELSYTKEEFRRSFCEHPVNRNQLPLGALERAIGDLSIKEEVIDTYGYFLRERPIPIRFILPNQALAIQLCLCPDFQDRHLLIKLGTGQGKSLVIALAALNEARKMSSRASASSASSSSSSQAGNGRVFVFTSYDHLARRDSALGEHFFKKDGIESVCISNIGDISSLSSDTKIIYADIETIDEIVQEVMLELLQGRATPAKKEFLKIIYGIAEGETRLVLDEHDLLLYDLARKRPFVKNIPRGLLGEVFVRNNRSFWPELANKTEQSSARTSSSLSEQKIESTTGKPYYSTDYYDDRGFHLPVSTMRLSRLVQEARRVIGLSGTASQDEDHGLAHPLFFEIPASQDPEVFGTKIQENRAEQISGESYISCHQTLQIPILRMEGDVAIVGADTIKRYCDAVVADIKEVKILQQTDTGAYQRPILIFADPTFKCRRSDSRVTENLWNALRTAMATANISFDTLTEDLSDSELQRIARQGGVTLATIKHGRGVDIRVNLDIEEGLHVIIGTSVIHRRMLKQLIGRTGRMGRKGSYSAITIGDLIQAKPALQAQQSEFYNFLHDITKAFIQRQLTIPTYNADDCKRWMMVLGRAYASGNQKINRGHVERLCGTSFGRGPLDQFFN